MVRIPKYNEIMYTKLHHRFSGKTVRMIGPLSRREYAVEIEAAKTLENLGWTYAGNEIVESGGFLESTIFEFD